MSEAPHGAFPSNAGGSVQAWKVSAQGGEERVLTSGHERMRHVFYSPDGRWIYVQPSHRNIYRLPADGGPLQRVTNFPESGLFIEEPTISPDGKFLVYSRSRGGSSLCMALMERRVSLMTPVNLAIDARHASRVKPHGHLRYDSVRLPESTV